MKTNLMAIRKRAGWKSRDAFAEHIGVNKFTYKTWEDGSTTMNAEQLLMCAVELDCSCDEILGHDVPSTYADPREAELHRVWGELDRERQNRLIATAHDMEIAKSGGNHATGRGAVSA